MAGVEEARGKGDFANDLRENGGTNRVAVAVAGDAAGGGDRRVGEDYLAALAAPKREAGVIVQKLTTQIAKADRFGHAPELHHRDMLQSVGEPGGENGRLNLARTTPCKNGLSEEEPGSCLRLDASEGPVGGFHGAFVGVGHRLVLCACGPPSLGLTFILP